MKLDGVQIIAADRMTVWRALNDPDILQASIPGCEEMVQTSPSSFEAVVVQKIGPVKATFKGAVELQDVIEGESLTLAGEGKGGVAGMAKGSARVALSDADGGGTQLSYEAEGNVAGKIAQLGSRLIDGVANKMANAFFENFKGAVEGDASSTVIDVAAPLPIPDQTSPTPGRDNAAADDVWDTARNVASHTGLGTVAAGGAAAAAAVGASARDAMADAAGAAGIDAGNASTAIDKAGAAVGDAARDATATVDKAIGGASARVDGALDMARESAHQVSGDAGHAAHGAAQGVEAVAHDAQSTIGGGVDAAKDRLVAGVEQAQDAMRGESAEAQIAAAGSVAETVRESVTDAGALAVGGAAAAEQTVSTLAADAGAVSGDGAAALDAAVEQANAAMAEGARDARDTLVETHTNVDSVDHAVGHDDGGDWAKGAAVAAAGTAAAVASGLASKAGAAIDSAHDYAKERVIESGKDIDEAKEWSDAKTHAGAAVDDAGDAIGDAWDAAKAKAAGLSDKAAEEWDNAKENASDAVSSAGMAASSGYNAAKGEAADIAQNPRMGPGGKPWYLWIILAAIAALILWLIFG